MNYDDNNPQHRKQLNDYLTRPRKNLDRVVYDPNIKEKKKPSNALDDLSLRLAKATSLYDDNKEADRTLRNLLIDKMNKGQPLDSDEVRFMMETKPKQPEATPQQMAALKSKMQKYKYLHGETKAAKNMNDYYNNKKPFKKKSAVLSIPRAEEPKTEEPKKEVTPKEPEEPLKDMIARLADERLKREQDKYDREVGTTGITKLLRPV